MTSVLAAPLAAVRFRPPARHSWRKAVLSAVLVGLAIAVSPTAWTAEVIPPSPARHFNDFANAVPATTAQQLDRELVQFERDTSNQIVVAIYPHMQSPSSLDDYSVRVYQAWHLGQKATDNGALLLIFTEDRKMRIATGYGLEGALPDALCKRIIEEEIAPRLRAGDFGGGVTAGVHAMMAAAKGEYRGTGRTAHETQRRGSGGFSPLIFFGLFFLIAVLARRRSRSSYVYGRRGRNVMFGPTFWGGGGGGWGGGSGGGGGFSGGGGSTGGGGASGSW